MINITLYNIVDVVYGVVYFVFVYSRDNYPLRKGTGCISPTEVRVFITAAYVTFTVLFFFGEFIIAYVLCT